MQPRREFLRYLLALFPLLRWFMAGKEHGHGFTAEGARRIVDVVRRVENMPRNLRRPPAPRQQLIPQAIWLAQSTAYQANNTTAANWKVFSGSTAGSETATQLTGLSAYVRDGLVLPNLTYYLMEINGILEVMNPSLTFRGQVGSDVATATTGTVTIYTGAFGSQASISQTVTGVKNDSSCTVKANKMCTVIWVKDNQSWNFLTAYTA